MLANEFGKFFKITTFGESHGMALGVVIQGCPSGLKINPSVLTDLLQRRRPGSAPWVSARNEPEDFQILSGVFEGITLGTPIAIVVYNKNQKSKDYEEIKNNPRQGHADDTWKAKFSHVDHRGGGRSSGRETVARVMGGGVAKMFVHQLFPNLSVDCKITRIGHLHNKTNQVYPEGTEELLIKAKQEGQSYGGHIEVSLRHIPKNLGQPVFCKLKSELAGAMMGVGAIVGFELANAFDHVLQEGTTFHKDGQSQQYAGVRGGISTGEPIVMKLAMKPTSSIKDIAKKGRHDPCVLLRALPVIESMAYLVLADQILWSRLDQV